MKWKGIGGRKYLYPIQEQFRYIFFYLSSSLSAISALSANLQAFTPQFRHLNNEMISMTRN
jgi:hypothetical protein